MTHKEECGRSACDCGEARIAELEAQASNDLIRIGTLGMKNTELSERVSELEKAIEKYSAHDLIEENARLRECVAQLQNSFEAQNDGYKKVEQESAKLRAALELWLSVTPTRADGTYDPINNPQAILAQIALQSRQDSAGELLPPGVAASESAGVGGGCEQNPVDGRALGTPREPAASTTVQAGPVCSVPGHTWSYESGCQTCSKAVQDSKVDRGIFIPREDLEKAHAKLDLGESTYVALYLYPRRDTLPQLVQFTSVDSQSAQASCSKHGEGSMSVNGHCRACDFTDTGEAGNQK